jgi:hypothetical protein
MSELKEIFTEIYQNNLWTSRESKSGAGSELKNTEIVRNELPSLFKKFNIKTMLDIPCGDFNWMNHVDRTGIDYIGGDIVEDLIENNKKNYNDIDFRVLDVTKDELPKVDIIFVRDLLGHFNYKNIAIAISNMKKSGSKYLLTTCFTKWDFNSNIEDGGWRPINLMIKPFNFKPIYLINEDCVEGGGDYNDKCLIMFDLNRLECGK